MRNTRNTCFKRTRFLFFESYFSDIWYKFFEYLRLKLYLLEMNV